MSTSEAQADADAGSFREELVRHETSRRNHETVRFHLTEALDMTATQCGRCYLLLVMGLILVGAYLVVWSENMYEAHAGDECNQPLALMLRLLYFIALINIFQKEIIRCFCCYDYSRDGPVEPCRIKMLKRVTWFFTIAWPFAGGIMLMQTDTCNVELVAAMHTLLYYYLAVFLIVLVLPVFSVSMVLCLVRRGWMRAPRSRDAAPENFIEELPKLTYDADNFDDSKPGAYPSTCAICLDEFSGEKSISKTPCDAGLGHAFHTDCLRGWLQVSKSCPLCRVDLTERLGPA